LEPVTETKKNGIILGHDKQIQSCILNPSDLLSFLKCVCHHLTQYLPEILVYSAKC